MGITLVVALGVLGCCLVALLSFSWGATSFTVFGADGQRIPLPFDTVGALRSLGEDLAVIVAWAGASVWIVGRARSAVARGSPSAR